MLQGDHVTQSLVVRAWANTGRLTEMKESLSTLPLTATGGWAAAAAAFARVGDVKA